VDISAVVSVMICIQDVLYLKEFANPQANSFV